MAALTSGSWTITGANASLPNGLDVSITRRKKYVNLKLTMASGEWPAAGITLPSAGSLGFPTKLDYYIVPPMFATASGKSVTFMYTTGHKMRTIASVLASAAAGRTFQPLASAITQAARIFYVTAVGF